MLCPQNQCISAIGKQETYLFLIGKNSGICIDLTQLNNTLIIKKTLNTLISLQVSHKMFMEHFNGFHVDGWKKVTVGNFIYFLQDNPEPTSTKDTESEMTEKMIISSTSEVNDGKSLNQFYSSVLHEHADEVFIWCQDPSKLRTSRPQFWLILEISETEIQIFFQVRIFKQLIKIFMKENSSFFAQHRSYVVCGQLLAHHVCQLQVSLHEISINIT